MENTFSERCAITISLDASCAGHDFLARRSDGKTQSTLAAQVSDVNRSD
jgi:hypothetical protein